MATILHAQHSQGLQPPRVPRTDGPSPIVSSAATQHLQLAGVSAFAFQGTNAHAIMALTHRMGDSAPARQALLLSRQRHWFTDWQPHALVQRAVHVPGQALHFATALQQSQHAFLWDHQVAGRGLLPAAAMLELAGAVAWTLGSRSASALAGVTIPAPLVLSTAQPVVLSASLYPSSGRLTLQSSASPSAVHLAASAASVAECESKVLQASRPGWLPAATTVLAPCAAACVLPGSALQPASFHVHPAVIDCTTQASFVITHSHAPCLVIRVHRNARPSYSYCKSWFNLPSPS